MTVAVADLTDTVIHSGPEGASPVLKTVLGVPQGAGPWPTVVVVHEAFGVDAEMRKQVAHLPRSVTSRWFRPLARVAHMGPDPDAARDAWQRIDAFLSKHLGR